MLDVVVDGLEVLLEGAAYLVLGVRFAELEEWVVDLGVEEGCKAVEELHLAVARAC